MYSWNNYSHEVNSPLSKILTLLLGSPFALPSASILWTTSIPESTLPNTTWRPSNLPRYPIEVSLEKSLNSNHRMYNNSSYFLGLFFLVEHYFLKHFHTRKLKVLLLCCKGIQNYCKVMRNYQLVFTVVIKNCEPLVSDPAFAMDKYPDNHTGTVTQLDIIIIWTLSPLKKTNPILNKYINMSDMLCNKARHWHAYMTLYNWFSLAIFNTHNLSKNLLGKRAHLAQYASIWSFHQQTYHHRLTLHLVHHHGWNHPLGP